MWPSTTLGKAAFSLRDAKCAVRKKLDQRLQMLLQTTKTCSALAMPITSVWVRLQTLTLRLMQMQSIPE